jgi:hypothetical protein
MEKIILKHRSKCIKDLLLQQTPIFYNEEVVGSAYVTVVDENTIRLDMKLDEGVINFDCSIDVQNVITEKPIFFDDNEGERNRLVLTKI